MAGRFAPTGTVAGKEIGRRVRMKDVTIVLGNKNYASRSPRGSGAAINQAVSKRMVKDRQMRRTARRAHVLLQVRTKTLDNVLRPTFERRYPDPLKAA